MLYAPFFLSIFNLPLHEWSPDRYRGRTPMLYSPFILSTLIFLCTSGIPIAIGVELPCFILLLFFLLQSSSARVESRSLSGSNSHALFSFFSFYFNLPLHEWSPDRYRGRTPMLYAPFFLSIFNLPLHEWRDSNSHQRFWRPLFYP